MELSIGDKLVAKYDTRRLKKGKEYEIKEQVTGGYYINTEIGNSFYFDSEIPYFFLTPTKPTDKHDGC